jgi:hypothetical protein
MRVGIVIPVGDFSIEKKRRSYFVDKDCGHIHLQMSDDGHTVTCKDCNKQLSAYYVLELMMDALTQERERAEALMTKAKEERNMVCHLRAAKHLESIWRSRDALPMCPHCGEGITAEDALIIGRCSKQLHIQKIKNKIAAI